MYTQIFNSVRIDVSKLHIVQGSAVCIELCRFLPRLSKGDDIWGWLVYREESVFQKKLNKLKARSDPVSEENYKNKQTNKQYNGLK